MTDHDIDSAVIVLIYFAIRFWFVWVPLIFVLFGFLLARRRR